MRLNLRATTLYTRVCIYIERNIWIAPCVAKCETGGPGLQVTWEFLVPESPLPFFTVTFFLLVSSDPIFFELHCTYKSLLKQTEDANNGSGIPYYSDYVHATSSKPGLERDSVVGKDQARHGSYYTS